MNTNTHEIIPQLFAESLIRSTIIDGNPWFVAKDVCAALSIANPRDAISTLDEDEKGVGTTDTLGGPQETNMVSESGLYVLIFKSRKNEARAFRKWVTSEVLPALRRRGYYGRREKAMTVFVKELLDMGLESRDATKLAMSAFPPLTRREQKQLELAEANEATAPDEDAQAILNATKAGAEYRLKDLHSLLPANHRILTIRSVKGRDTALGQLMERLVRLGFFLRINARHATYERAGEKIVAMER